MELNALPQISPIIRTYLMFPSKIFLLIFDNFRKLPRVPEEDPKNILAEQLLQRSPLSNTNVKFEETRGLFEGVFPVNF